MKQSVYIHIGTPKTGTSFLQRKLRANKEELIASGFDYDPGDAYDHQSLVASINAQSSDAQKAESFISYVRQYDASKIILSSEAFSLSNNDWVRAVPDLADIDIHVCCFIRSPASYAESAYKQWGLKQPKYCDFWDFIAKWRHPDWAAMLRPWQECAKRIDLFPYVPRNIPILDQFNQFIGTELMLPNPMPAHDIWGGNPSYNATGAELAARLTRRFEMHDNRVQKFLRMHGNDRFFAHEKSSFVFFDREGATHFNEANERAISELAAHSDVTLPTLLFEYDRTSDYEPQVAIDESVYLDLLERLIRQL